MRGCSILVFAGLCSLLLGQNSTRKDLRVPPSEQAARAGSHVPWRKDLTAALAESKESGRPVFWFVPTVARSPMDRKDVVERYLLGGPFSWPSTIALLENHFVPVREVPRGELQKRYGLLRQRFIEPGYVILDGAGEVLFQLDQITTLHPEWFEAPLRRLVQAPQEGFPGAPALREAWESYRAGDFPGVATRVGQTLALEPADGVAAEALWLRGAAELRATQPDAAHATWRELAQRYPEHPLASKAKLETEGHGPFVRGFEDYLELPAAALTAAPVDGSRLPGVYDEAELWRRSVHFLLRMHDGTGVYRDSNYDFGGSDSLPNVWAATSCLAGMALLAADARQRDGRLQLAQKATTQLRELLLGIRGNAERGAWLALSDSDEILWARAYALRFLAAWSRLHERDREALQPELSRGASALFALQPETGAWFHEYGNPFATATALQALHDAKRLGCEMDADKITRGLAALARSRTPEGAYSYGATRAGRKPRASVAGAAGRMPLCELALYLFDKSDQERLTAAVTAGQRHHELLAAVRKYDDHADRHGYGGFFFWFDMLGRAEAVTHLADAQLRAKVAGELRAIVLDLPEFDGCFVDSHELGRTYGTAMALLVLDTLDRVTR
ncbi:MAG: hypothetical protein NXI31_25985 [bacterium]|nr:hypothetical protein [bacterium]